MSRIPTPAGINDAPEASRPLLEAYQRQYGAVPNMVRLIGNSPAALAAYMGFSSALTKGHLDPATQNRIALAVSQVDGCEYCLSAHTFLGRKVYKLEDAEMYENRSGTSSSARAAAAVHFAVKLMRNRGQVEDADVAALTSAGYGYDEILEIIAQVCLTTFTNYVNESLATDLDFPPAQASGRQPQRVGAD